MSVEITLIYVLLIYFVLFFFSGKSLKICSRSVLIFRGLTCDFFHE